MGGGVEIGGGSRVGFPGSPADGALTGPASVPVASDAQNAAWGRSVERGRSQMMSPRSVARIAVGLGIFACLLFAFIFALRINDHAPYVGAKAITAALMAATLAVIYRYVEH